MLFEMRFPPRMMPLRVVQLFVVQPRWAQGRLVKLEWKQVGGRHHSQDSDEMTKPGKRTA